MKHKNVVPRISLILLLLVATQVAYSAENGRGVSQEGTGIREAIPPAARFDLKEIADKRYVLVGRLVLRRQFLGTGATPPHRDVVQFRCFNGEELGFSTFTTPGLEGLLSKRLADGRSLPAVITARFERVRVGHDGINVFERLVARIEDCKVVTAESVCTAAEAAGFDTADCERFKATLDPDLVRDGVAVSLGKVSMRTRATPGGSGLAIHGIRVFNTTPRVATMEITGVEIEQEGVRRQCVESERSRAPRHWEVEAEGWSDGRYEAGKMPQTLWMFHPSGPVDPEKKAKVRLKLKLNGSEPLVLTRTVDPT